MLSKQLSLAFSFTLLAKASAAVIYSETHTITAGSPTTGWNVYSNSSLGGETRRFDFTTFTVSATGSYSFKDTGAGIGDTVVGIYSASFNTSDLSIGWLTGDDDFDWQGSGLAINLTAGQTYTIVTSPYMRVEFIDELGDIEWQVDGPVGATLTPVPEPETAVIVSAAGLLGVAVWRRAVGRKSPPRVE
jgi:hypothetical protein